MTDSGVCFDVYKGRTKVGIIEVTDDSLLSEKNYGSRFDASMSEVLSKLPNNLNQLCKK